LIGADISQNDFSRAFLVGIITSNTTKFPPVP